MLIIKIKLSKLINRNNKKEEIKILKRNKKKK